MRFGTPDETRFRYVADPLCIGAALTYVAGRWFLKPHHLGGWFVHDYLNDVLCLPLFLPLSLCLQRLLGLRRHNGAPRLWEILQHWAVFTILFEVVLPRFPQAFRTTADPLDTVAYLLGGLAAWAWWSRPSAACPDSALPQTSA